jgi:NADH dehydrogenase FAD-containing subunit
MQLSKNLSLAEVVRSESAKRNGISNNPTKEHLANLVSIALNVFQPIRDHFLVPIHISSGYRSAALNASIKGASKTSQHSKGQALDIDMDNTKITNKQIFDFIKDNIEFDQLIWEFGTDKNPDWVHVSYAKGKNRKQILKAVRRNGKTSYINF